MRKYALITGGTRGIGLGIAEALAGRGFSLAVNGVRVESEVKPVLEKLRKQAPEVIYCQGNISNTEGRERILHQVKEAYGTVDVLVNNAGVAPENRQDILETTEQSYDRVMDINLKGTFFFTQQVAKLMLEGEREVTDVQRCIINVSSVSAVVASIQRPEYCLSKAGMSMLTSLFAVKMAEHNIPVYEIRPGLIKTDMTAAVTQKYDHLIADGLLLQQRWGMPGDVGKVVAAMATGMLPYSTGQVVNVDGGMLTPKL